MSITLSQMTLPTYQRMLANLKAILQKGEAHAIAKKIEPSVFLTSRLFPDMFALTRQVQIASDSAKGACARLSGQEIPKYEDTEASFAELYARIDKTLAYINSVNPESIDGAESREIVIPVQSKELRFNGRDYVVQWALPTFYFHVMAAYAILRHNGVDVGKWDFLGSF